MESTTHETQPETQNPESTNLPPATTPPPPATNQFPFQIPEDWGGERAEESCSNAPVRFTFSPLDLDDIEYIIPMGALTGTHITPVDHQYYYPLPWKMEARARPVYAPANGTVTHIGRLNFAGDASAGDQGASDYRMYIEYSCNVYSIFIHITTLSDRILEETGEIAPGANRYLNLPVTAGEEIGTIQGSEQRDMYALDFSVHDERVVLPGFVVPEHYDGEDWKVHTVDPFDYFEEPLRSELLAKNLRSAEPLGGKIDYDLDGKLVGNWFREGSNGYGGGGDRYWESHLAIVYNHIDPSAVVISIGDLEGGQRQFAVRGNRPDPAGVSVASGKVKYELIPFDYSIGTGNGFWDFVHFEKNLKVREREEGGAYGTLVVQLLEDRKLKMEVFEGKSPSQVNAFTTDAKIYTR